jgi:hypothetical protein
MREFLQELIHFRNVGHELHFYFSMVLFFGCVVVSFLFKKKEIISQLALYHLSVAIVALFVVVVFKKNCEMFSVDCIWFNGLMAVIYKAIFFGLLHQQTGSKKGGENGINF